MSDDFKKLEEEELPIDEQIGEEITEEDIANAEVVAGDDAIDPVFREKQLFGETLRSLINLLPDQYNKEVSDTNYYKLLRSVALELANAKVEVLQLKDDMYLSSVQPARIYENFGTLVKLQKSNDWDSEKYRRLIQGVIQSLLRGPTKKSLIDGLNLFTDFKINLYELYKAEDRLKVDPSLYKDIDYQYSFVLEIEKPVEAFADQRALIRDANYIVNIIKPAHTISVIITTLVGDESYRQSYRERFKINEQEQNLPEELRQFGLPDYHGMDVVQTEAELNHRDNTYGYKYKGDGVFGVGSLIGGPDLIGPVYFLQDVRQDWYFEQWLNTEFEKPDVELANVGLEYADGMSVVDKFKDIVPHLKVDYVEWFKTLQMKNQVTDLKYDLSDAYDKSKNTDILQSHLEWTHKESHILSNELEEYDDKGVEFAEQTYATPMMARKVQFDITWEEDYNKFMNKGRFSLSSTLLGSRLVGDNLLTAPTPDVVDNINLQLNEAVQRQFWEDVIEQTYIQWNPTETFNTLTSIKDHTTEIGYVQSDTYNTTTQAIDHVTQNAVVVAESVNITTKVIDKDSHHYEAPTYTETYTPNKEELTNEFDNKETSDIVYMQLVPRFTFNQTIVGKSRLGGVIRDQSVMKLEYSDGTIQEAAVN